MDYSSLSASSIAAIAIVLDVTQLASIFCGIKCPLILRIVPGWSGERAALH